MHDEPTIDPITEQQLLRIALDHLFIDTLQTCHSDRLDFHEVSVWGVRSALIAAYQAGLRAAQPRSEPGHKTLGFSADKRGNPSTANDAEQPRKDPRS